MEDEKYITVEATVHAPLKTVWTCWTEPQHITRWVFASDDWEAPRAENNLVVGGRFMTRMQAKDGSAGFDFGGVYTRIDELRQIDYTMDGGRTVRIKFLESPDGVRVRETFEIEDENPKEMQRDGWQSILNNFKSYTEREARDTR